MEGWSPARKESPIFFRPSSHSSSLAPHSPCGVQYCRNKELKVILCNTAFLPIRPPAHMSSSLPQCSHVVPFILSSCATEEKKEGTRSLKQCDLIMRQCCIVVSAEDRLQKLSPPPRPRLTYLTPPQGGEEPVCCCRLLGNR